MRSDTIKKGFDKAPHRSLLRATGLKDEDFEKPFIGIANSYIDIIPGHFFLHEYGEIVKEAIREAGGRHPCRIQTPWLPAAASRGGERGGVGAGDR